MSAFTEASVGIEVVDAVCETSDDVTDSCLTSGVSSISGILSIFISGCLAVVLTTSSFLTCSGTGMSSSSPMSISSSGIFEAIEP